MGDVMTIESFPGGSIRGRDQEILQRFERDLKRSESHGAHTRRLMKRYYRTYSGDPWNERDRQFLETDLRRPVANFNLALGTLNAVVGADQADRKEIRFEGVSTEDLYDTSVAEWLTKLSRSMFNHFTCNGHRIQSAVFLDGLITGYGFSRTFLNTRRYPFRVKTESLRPWLVFTDPDSWEDGLSDSRFIIYREDWEKEDVQASWPQKAKHLEGGSTPVDPMGSSQMPRSVNADNYQTGSGSSVEPSAENKIRIYQYQFMQLDNWVAFTGPDGQDHQLPQAEFDKAFPEPPDHARFPKEVRYNAFIGSGVGSSDRRVLLELKPLPVDSFTISAYTGLKDVNIETGKVSRFGLMHIIYEPQMWSAKVLSLALEKLAKSGKGVHIVEEGAVADPDEFKRQVAMPNGVVVLEDNALQQGRYRFERAESMPTFIGQMLQISQDGIQHTSAVTDWLKGTATQERSNVLISNLQSQSMMALSPLIEPLTAFRLSHGLLFTQLAVKYLSEKTINKALGNPSVPGLTHEQDPDTGRVLDGPDGQPVPLVGPKGPITAGTILKRADIFEFDVQVDTGQASPTAKQAFWRAMVDTALLQKLFEHGVEPAEILPELLKNSPLPVEMTKPLVTKLETALKRPNPEKLLQMFEGLPPDQQQQALQAMVQTIQGQQPAAPQAVQ